jgi:hypothetical protein
LIVLNDFDIKNMIILSTKSGTNFLNLDIFTQINLMLKNDMINDKKEIEKIINHPN